MELNHPKASGCLITRGDTPRIWASITVYLAALVFGSGIASLGVALPQLADSLGMEETSLGILFTARGGGVLVGALFSAMLLELENPYLPKHIVCFLVSILAGIAVAAVPLLAMVEGIGMHTLCIPYFFQGAAFGTIDSFSAVAIAEMWGQRMQPWMQMKNMLSGMGAVVAPILVASYGFEIAFYTIGVFSVVGVFSLVAEKCVLTSEQKQASAVAEIDFAKADEQANLKDRRSSITNVTCYQPVDDGTLMAGELAVLQSSLNEIDATELQKTENWQDLTDEVLQSTEYSNIPEQRRDDPDYEFPAVNRTLSFAPQAVADMARQQAHFGIELLPPFGRILLIHFVFWQIGLLYSTGGWMSAYLDMSGVHSRSRDINSTATMVTTLFYISQTIGSIISVPASMFFSTSTLMQLQLGTCLFGCVLLLLPTSPFMTSVIASCSMGLGLSCLYPLAMGIVNDYGITMDSRSTVALVIGACLGEAIAPMAVGALLHSFGAEAFPVYIFVAVVALLGSYILLHVVLSRHVAAFQMEQQHHHPLHPHHHQHQHQQAFPQKPASLPAQQALSDARTRSRSRSLLPAGVVEPPQMVVDLVQRMLPHHSSAQNVHPRSRATSNAQQRRGGATETSPLIIDIEMVNKNLLYGSGSVCGKH